ncbi:MAG: LVIVD repeat-containing protein [Candidatus Heimdallarchaeota archaeon]
MGIKLKGREKNSQKILAIFLITIMFSITMFSATTLRSFAVIEKDEKDEASIDSQDPQLVPKNLEINSTTILLGMSKFDISQKDNPILLGTYSKDNELFSGDFFVKDDIAFVNDALADEFKILNVSNINQVIEISSINVTYSSKLIDITENVLLFGSNNEEIFLYNITNLKSPTLLQFINLSSTTINIQDFAVKDDILYIIDELGDFIFYNLTNPSLPVLIDTFDNPINGYNIELQFYEDYMFTRQRNRTSFFNITDIHNPNYISSINITTGYIKGCAIYDNILYVLNSTLFIYNVTDIANPVFVSTFTDISSSEKMLIITDYIFITKYSESLNVLDIVDKINPQLIATFGFGGWTRDIFCDGNTAVVANEQDGVLFFDITDKANLVLLNHMKTNHSIRNVILHNNRLYTIRSGQYIDIYNVANIEVPLLFGTYEIPLPFLQSYTDFILDGDYLILMKFNGGFEVIDVSDPSSPVQVSEYVLAWCWSPWINFGF